MGKSHLHTNNDSAAIPVAVASDPAQLNFFDPVMPPTMTTENTLSTEAEHSDAIAAPASMPDIVEQVQDKLAAVADEIPGESEAAAATSNGAPFDATQNLAIERDLPSDAVLEDQEAAPIAADDSIVAPLDVVEPVASAQACTESVDEVDAAVGGAAEGDEAVRSEISLDIPFEESLGQRLRAAREARGMRCEEAAQQMRLPLLTVQALEADRYERIGEGIYLRSYLSKYLRLLDLPQVLADRVLNQHCEPPPLITSGTISRPRYLFERYSSSALYLILTAVIIVPAVWLARGGFEPTGAQITPLDAPATAATSTATAGEGSAPRTVALVDTASDKAEKPADQAPLVASLAPFPAIKHDSASEPAEKPATAVVHAGEHNLRMTLAEASWVEVVAADGEKLDYGLLPAGTVRTYHSSKSIDVRLGNCNGATVEVDGQAQDLTAYRRSNVAHFKLSGGESMLSHSGG